MHKRALIIFVFSIGLLTACNVNVVGSTLGASRPKPQESDPDSELLPQPALQKPASADSGNHSPMIQQILVNPSATAGPDDILTLRALANDADGDGLRLSWQTTKGLLSSDQGEVVTWKPKLSDGSIASGVATVSVLASDNSGGTATASVNITIAANDSAALPGAGGEASSSQGAPDAANAPAPPSFVEEGP